MFDDEVFSPEQDPIDTQEVFISTEADRENIHEYQQTGSLMGTKMFDDLRGDLLKELKQEVSSRKMAQKFAELLDANNEIKDGEGNVIASKPDYRTQYKTLELLTSVRGDTAPKKNLSVSANIKDMKFLTPVKQKDIEEGAEYAAQRLKE